MWQEVPQTNNTLGEGISSFVCSNSPNNWCGCPLVLLSCEKEENISLPIPCVMFYVPIVCPPQAPAEDSPANAAAFPHKGVPQPSNCWGLLPTNWGLTPPSFAPLIDQLTHQLVSRTGPMVSPVPGVASLPAGSAFGFQLHVQKKGSTPQKAGRLAKAKAGALPNN